MAKQCRELPVRTMRSRLHRSQRDSEFLGDLAVGHAVEMMHANDCRFLMRQGLIARAYPPDSVERIEVGRQGDERGVVGATSASALVGRRDSRR